MIGIIVRRQILEHLISARFALLTIVCLLLMGVSSFVGKGLYLERLEEYRTQVKLHRSQAGTYGVTGGSLLNTMGEGGVMVDRPPSQLGIFFRGVNDDVADTFWLNEYDGPIPEVPRFENSFFSFFSMLDWGFVIGLVFSLFALILSHDAVCGEKEDGTLRLMLSNEVSRGGLLLGKWLGGLVCLFVPFVASAILGLLIVISDKSISLHAGELGAWGVIFLFALVYISAFYGVGLLISTAVKRSSVSIALCLSVWTVMLFLVPSVSAYVAQILSPMPYYSEFFERRHERFGYYWRDYVKEKMAEGHSREEAVKMSKEYANTHIWPKVRENIRKTNRWYMNEVSRQVGISANLARISPYACFTMLSTNLAGTGAREKEHFEEQVIRYRDRYIQYYHEKWERVWQGKDSPWDISDLPHLDYRQLSLAEKARISIPDMAILAVLNVLLFMGAYAAFLRYDVR